MFPAYSNKDEIKPALDISWLQCSSYDGPVGNRVKESSESSDTNDELAHALERQKVDHVEDRAQKRERSSSSDSSEISHRKHKSKHLKKHKKKEKKHKKDKKHKKRRARSRSGSPNAVHLRRKWAFLEDIGPTKINYIVDPKGDQSNKAFEQLPHTSAAVYKIRKQFQPRKKEKRYFKAKVLPPSVSVAVNEKLKVLKPTSYISLGDALLDEDDDRDGSSWPSLIKEHANLSNRCRNEPRNVQLWLKLCDFEKVFVPCSLAGSNIDAIALQKAISEKQLSVMSEAISKNPIVLELRLKKFDLLCALDRQEELSREWDDVLRMSDYSIERQDLKNALWLKYAQYARSKFRVVAKFSLEDATAGYRRAIEAYQKTRIDDNFLVELIADYVDFLSECGHSEKAVAIFQALLDFNLSQPGYLSTERDEDALKRMFELFWESGCSRVGEDNHAGWAQFKDSSATQPLEENRNFQEEDEITSSEQSINVKWAMLEVYRQRKQWKPARLNAEDVEQIVLFDDIQMFLFRTRSKICIKKMLSTFMSYLSRGDGSYLGHDDGSLKMHQLLKIPLAEVELDGLTSTLFNCYEAGVKFLPEFSWAAELLDRLLDLAPHNKNELISLGKKVLQHGENQSDLLIWTKLLKLYAFSGSRDEAISKGVKLLRMLSASPTSFRGDPLGLLATFLEIHLDVHRITATEIQENVAEMPDIKPLFSFWGALVDGRKASLSDVNQQDMETLRVHLRKQRTEDAVEIATILELALYGPTDAYSFLCSAASHISKSAYHRLNVLLHLLVSKHFIPSLTSLKSTLRLACVEHPTRDHLVLLASLAYKSPLAWRSCPIPQDDAEVSWFAILLFHLLRSQEYEDWREREEVTYFRTPLGSVRRAMAQLGELRNPLFWRLRAWAEIQAGERDRAKGLLLRGLQSCPWSKALFVDCALYFEDMLEQVIDSLTEKGLRLRTPLEEIQLLTQTAEQRPEN